LGGKAEDMGGVWRAVAEKSTEATGECRSGNERG